MIFICFILLTIYLVLEEYKLNRSFKINNTEYLQAGPGKQLEKIFFYYTPGFIAFLGVYDRFWGDVLNKPGSGQPETGKSTSDPTGPTELPSIPKPLTSQQKIADLKKKWEDFEESAKKEIKEIKKNSQENPEPLIVQLEKFGISFGKTMNVYEEQEKLKKYLDILKNSDTPNEIEITKVEEKIAQNHKILWEESDKNSTLLKSVQEQKVAALAEESNESLSEIENTEKNIHDDKKLLLDNLNPKGKNSNNFN